MESSTDSKKSFLKYVFNFDEDSKMELMNILQFALIGVIPVTVLIKLLDKYIPESDDKKGSIEILAEIAIQLICLLVGLFFIIRVIMYFPTFSGIDYPKLSILTITLTLLVSMISTETHLTDKINILLDRLYELWEGKTSDTKKKQTQSTNNSNVKVSQPISQRPIMNTQLPNRQTNYNDGTSINSLPTQEMASSSQSEQLPNYNAMYRNDSTPLVNAATPGQSNEGFSNEPMAASDALGGGWGGFSSW